MDSAQRQQFHELRRLCMLGATAEVEALLAGGVSPNPAPDARGNDAAPPLGIVVSRHDPGRPSTNTDTPGSHR